MYKVKLLLLITLVAVSCSTVKKRKGAAINRTDSVETIIENVRKQNITSGSFFIEKAEFIVRGNGEEKSGTGNIKFLKTDNFLVSIKTRAGIEIGRIHFTGDSLKVNDRINKNYYSGSVLFLKRKYGIETDLLPLLLGDLIDDSFNQSASEKCFNNEVIYEGSVRGVKVNYVIDCSLQKIVRAVPEIGLKESKVEITYSDFFNANGINIPGKIVIRENIERSEVEIGLKEILIPWEGNVDLIPGKGYSKIPLR